MVSMPIFSETVIRFRPNWELDVFSLYICALWKYFSGNLVHTCSWYPDNSLRPPRGAEKRNSEKVIRSVFRKFAISGAEPCGCRLLPSWGERRHSWSPTTHMYY